MKRTLSVLLGAIATLQLFGDANDLPLLIDYERSSIEISGKAFGFIPATFLVEHFQAVVAASGNPIRLKKADFMFSYQDLKSGHEGRDRKIHNWLESKTYPEGRFTLRKIENEEGVLIAVGPLTLHGVSKEARFEYRIEENDGIISLNAVAKINYSDWGLPPLRIFIFKIRPALKISLNIEARRDSQFEAANTMPDSHF